MQILMTKAAAERVRGKVAAIAPDAQIITLAPGGLLEIDGAPTAAESASPEIAWMSVDALFAGLAPAMTDLISAGSVKWAQVAAAGLDRPMFTTMMAAGVRLSKGVAQSPPIAEYVVSHALSLLHPIAEQAAKQRAHAWERVNFREIASTRWMLIGYGAIGHLIAQRIKPFGVDLTAVRRATDADTLADRSILLSEAGSLLPQMDVVVLACALNDETRKLANAEFFAAMKPGAILINIARGGVVDETALRDALDRDQPAHAVLDVFETEPLPTDSWLWDHPKVRVTAHTSNAGDGNTARGDAQFLANIKRYLAGEAPSNEAHKSEVGL
ncbi:NAD(P)-dependent oxidoreductase [Phenylobacterium immobile]|uniref:NAD(P)-dependent oxidoreductase n=1 Tax=Phenylobacterium immobile TaxID=21 RepID=UPI000B126D52|nr:NAD(P)-dependent oxidoreductase [Phenylobacterium immobile]